MNQENGLSFLAGVEAAILKFAQALEIASEWYTKNAENINKYLLAFSDFGIWLSATDKLAKSQIVFTDDLSNQLASRIYHSSDISVDVKKHYFDNNQEKISQVIERCRNSEWLTNYIELYSQTINAYKSEHYHLACLGLFSIIDGILSDVTGKITSTNFKCRIDVIEKKISDQIELNQFDRKTLCIYQSMQYSKDSFFKNSDFSKLEPDELNRHWLVHGRTKKIYTNFEFLKTLLCLDGIIYLSSLSENDSESD